MSGLIAHAGKIWLAVDPVDMRRGMDGLSMIVRQVLGHPPCAGSAFIFCNRAGNRIRSCCGMARGCGYVSAACIRGGLSGRGRMRRVSS